MTLALIVAATKEGHIGNDNALSWFLPSDLKWFKDLTLNKIVVMGRKTYESIGKPLPKRINHVISRTLDQKEGIEIYSSIEEWKEKNQALIEDKEVKVFVIGGVEIYNQFFDMVSEIYFSELDETENQKLYNKFDKKIDFSPEKLLSTKNWHLKEAYRVYDEKSFYKNDLKKTPISYGRYVLSK